MTGSIVTFNDAIPFTPIEKIIAQIDPVQDLHGYDSPWPAGGGKNLAKLTFGNQVPSVANGQMVSSNGWSSDFIAVDNASNYTVSFDNTYGRYVLFYGINNQYLGFVQAWTASGYLLNNYGNWSNVKYVKLRIDSTESQTFELQLELGSTATAWSPYSNICPISGWAGVNVWNESTYDQTAQPKLQVSWQDTAGTVYGGSMTVNEDGSGELVVDRATDTITGSGDFGNNGVQAYGGIQVRYTPTSSKKYAPSQATQNEGLISDKFDSSVATISAQCQVTGRSTSGNIFFNMPADVTTFDGAKTWFTNNPTQISYLLDTPLTYHFDNLTQLTTLIGTNNIWADTGDVTVTYQSTDSGLPLGYSFGSPLGEYNSTNLHLFNDTFIENGMGD